MSILSGADANRSAVSVSRQAILDGRGGTLRTRCARLVFLAVIATVVTVVVMMLAGRLHRCRELENSTGWRCESEFLASGRG